VGFELTTLVVIGTDCTGSCKTNYHTIKTMMTHLPLFKFIWNKGQHQLLASLCAFHRQQRATSTMLPFVDDERHKVMPIADVALC
jgi:hypothetical protein